MFQLPADSALSAFSREGVERLCFFNLVASPDERYFFKDRESRFVLVSDGWLAGVGQGHALEEVVGKTDFDFTGHDQAMIAFQEEQRVITTGEPMVARIDRDWAPGRPDTWLQVVKLPLRDGEGKIVGTWGITRDVTAQVDAERALAASESQYRSLFEHNPQPMMAYARDARQIVAVSSAAVAAYGYTREEFLGMTIDDLIPAEAQPLTGPPSHGFSGATQAHHQYKDGTVIDVEITSDDLTLDGHECRIALCLNVTERNRTTAELAIARDAAVEASNTKSAFLANMSHEIRTPMAGVLGMAELLLDSRLDDDQRELLTHISRSGELLMGLINDVLDLSKIEARQLTLDIADFALRETIEQACAVAGMTLRAKGAAFELRIGKAVPERACGDGQRLRQVLLNLVSNAVKFTTEGKVTVRVGAKRQAGGATVVRIEVVDTGIGIDPALIDKLFEPFTQADVSTTRKYGGTGLGLAIARELTELMGGTIGVHSVHSVPGAGSTFWIELPLPAAVAVNGQPSGVVGVTGTASPQWLTPPRLLVAEDGLVNQIVAVRTLKACGCQTEVASDGVQALEMLSTRHYDAVLMDCQMPMMDGYQATAELRRRENGGHHTPVIAMTAHAMVGAVEQCLGAGMDDYISKPLRRATLMETLRRWIPTQSDIAVTDPTEEPVADRS